MTSIEQEKAASDFVEKWIGRGDEKSETHNFWIELLRSVYDVKSPENIIEFEKRVQLDHTSFIDGYITTTQVLIEQKSIDIDLKKGYKQSDGSFLTPFQQAHRYAAKLPRSEFPRWIIVCNFKSFLVYDMEKPNNEPEEIDLKDLRKEYYRLSFIMDTGNIHLQKEMALSIHAGNIVGELYDALLVQYNDHDTPSPETLRSLNMLCVRLVFCLYAEDTGIFGHKSMFGDYLKQFSAKELRNALLNLFQVLDQDPVKNERDPYIDESLAAFPYVNGGLFTEEDKTIPQLTDKIKDLLIAKASDNFNWSEISPTIFGAIFESTLNPETRRSGGMHYTSIENIHKVIDPLFLDDLQSEYEKITTIRQEKLRIDKAIEFQKKLGSLKFLDPACGSGNFLTESYLSLRKLENQCLRLRFKESVLDVYNDTIFVSIHQFYGIEINDFACVVAKTALWIAENQMMEETSRILNRNLNFLPLKSYASIIEGNALRIDWTTIGQDNITTSSILEVTNFSNEGTCKFDYIMGNPPFVGYTYQNKEQKVDIESIMPEGIKNVDYVCLWYYKAAKLIQNSSTHAAFVSTNSITQGEQVTAVWKYLIEKYNIHINFAYRTFRWDSEASIKAHVHCVIIGFSCDEFKGKKYIFEGDIRREVKNINPYLIDADNIFIEKRVKPLCNVPDFFRGSQPTDDGNFLLSEEEKNKLLKEEPLSEKFIRPFMMGKDFIDRKPRYCLWLVGASPSELRKCPEIIRRIENVKQFRLTSTKPATKKKAESPTLFDEIKDSKTDYVAIPVVSSEGRRYIPIDYLSSNIIAGNKLFVMPDASLYDFGILTSNVHMAWMRVVCGRLKSDYSYSNTIVYNNFPWCTPTDEQKNKIEQTALSILDARAKYTDCSLADLYDETLMPTVLRKAHQENDKAVMQAYGFPIKMTESECVAELFKMYKKLVKKF